LKACCETGQVNSVAIGKITQWIEIDRERTLRDHQEFLAERLESREARDAIMGKLDELKKSLK
jgi:hypothetical protein